MKHLTATYRPIFRYGLSRIGGLLVLLVLLFGTTRQALAQQFVIPLYDNENQKENQNGTLMVGVDNVLLTECGTDELGFTMSFALLGGTLPRQQRVFIIPQLMLDDEVANFPAIEIMGSWAYYHDIRTPQDTLHVPDTLQYRDREAQNYQVYQQTVARQQWMGVALLRLLVVRTDGCGTELNHEERVLRVPTPIITDSNANKVVQVNNIQQLRGRAYLSYPVRVTEVEPDYLNNRYELERLRNTIDSVSNDSTIEILRIQVKGYASPDGSYELNDRLARERTGSLARYIIEHTNVAPKLFHTSSEPEDWQGLRNFVDSTSLVAHRDSLLLLIDSDMDPDDKLHRIAATWPDDYRTLKDEAFPLLRHTDYQIDYQLKEVKEEALEAKLDTTYLLITDAPAGCEDQYALRPGAGPQYRGGGALWSQQALERDGRIPEPLVATGQAELRLRNPGGWRGAASLADAPLRWLSPLAQRPVCWSLCGLGQVRPGIQWCGRPGRDMERRWYVGLQLAYRQAPEPGAECLGRLYGWQASPL